MGHQVVWAACSVTNPNDGKDSVLAKGDMLPGWVTDFTKFVLTTSGAVQVTDDPAPEAETLPDPVRLAEHPPPPAVRVNFRSSKEELIEYGAAQGDDRAELDKLTVKQLQEKYVRS